VDELTVKQESEIYRRDVFSSWLGWLVPGTILVDVSNRRSALHKGQLSQVRQSKIMLRLLSKNFYNYGQRLIFRYRQLKELLVVQFR
jgi:hypothetical protein